MKIQEFDYSIDLLRSLLWRHNEAVNLQALIQNKNNALDDLNKDFWESWVEDIFNLDTANRFGLSVWSIILNIPLSIAPETPANNNGNFGFGQYRKNFNNGNFTDAVNDIILSLEQARIVLKLRYYQLVARGTIPECTKIVTDVFGDLGTVTAFDNYNMTMAYVFAFEIPAPLRLILNKYDLLPRPSGVKVIYNEIPNNKPNGNFGFGSNRINFNNSNFGS